MTSNVDMSRIPAHIAIIMDGNGRWAARRGLPRQSGHIEGAKKFQEIALFCQELGVKHLTVYAFSTENWKRPPEEVSAIMHLFRDYLLNAKKELLSRNIHINILGDTGIFAGSELGELIAEVTSMNLGADALQANIAINYGGREELVRAANRAFAEKGGPIAEEDIAQNLYTAGQPDPELIIRTSGEYRLSGFMLWQCSYSELVFSETLWPDFSKEELLGAVADFQCRDRRYGGVKK
ncbi:MAG TPA: polyprenyl diphosphate synthase [Terriglobales bacterium]|nr:polyprenyl diphosphate synthase [Terriglobales bacterium]